LKSNILPLLNEALRLFIFHQSTFLGIVFLRPGHFDSSYHIQTFQALLNVNPEIESPFMVIAEWAKGGVKIRIKNAMIY
jgi:hypothetical protein